MSEQNKKSKEGIWATRPMATGFATASMIGVSFYVLPAALSQTMGSMLVGVMAGVYWGFAVKSVSTKSLVQETIILGLYMGIAAYSLNEKLRGNGKFVGIGVALHGIYDLLHHFQLIPYGKHVPKGYGLACAATDFPLGAFLYWLWQ